MDRSYGRSPITPTPQDPPRWTRTMGEAPSLRRLRTQLNGQELWESPNMPTPQDPAKWTGAMGKAPAWRRSRTHLDGQELWESPNMPTPQDPAKWKGAMGEARHADAPGPTKMDRSYGKAPTCRRLRTHLDGQELWESPNMPTPQDPPRWTGAVGEGQSPGRQPNVTRMSPRHGGG